MCRTPHLCVCVSSCISSYFQASRDVCRKYRHFIDNFAGRTCAVARNDELTSEGIQGIGASSKVKEVPRYQQIVAPRRRPTHPPVLTYSLISRQLASVHGSQHSMNSRPSKIWKLGRTYHRGVASGPNFFTCAK